MAEYWKLVPRDLEGNLKYRLAVRKRCAVDLAFRACVTAACKADFLFFCLVFAVLHEPRGKIKKIPFLVWDHQIPVIQEILANLGQRDVCVDKCRGEGMSWICVLISLWMWLFHSDATIGMVSSTEKKSDNPGNMDSLGCKLDMAIAGLPKWMVGEFDRNASDHSFVNKRTGSQINLFAATKGTGRGGRYTFFVLDELAEWNRGKDAEVMKSTQQATNCRIIVSTPNGPHGAYYEFLHKKGRAIKLVMDWKMNPSKNRGLYRVINNIPIAVDPVNNPLPPGYEAKTKDTFSLLREYNFPVEGTTRSPWYDEQCLREDSSPSSIAQELDRDFAGSQKKIYTQDFFDAVAATVKAPLLKGSLDYDEETLKPSWGKGGDGDLSLWCELDINNLPPDHTYAISADIAQGLGGQWGSNSVAEVIDLVTGEQVGELVTGSQRPSDFADQCVALCKFFHNAYLAWEINGPGGDFSRRIKELKYPSVYMRDQPDRKGRIKSKSVGWHTRVQTRPALFGALGKAVKSKKLVLRSEALYNELHEYKMLNGVEVHSGALATDDESSKNEAHGDRVIAMGVGAVAMKDRFVPKGEKFRKKPPVDSMEARELEYQKQQETDGDVWDSRENADLVRG